LILPKVSGCPVSDLACAGLDTLAVRVPGHAVARDLIAGLGRPIVAPSANRSGHVSPTTAQHVFADLEGRIDVVLDGGATPIGVESTIVACLDGESTLLRPGGLARADIEAALGRALPESNASNGGDAPLAPGMLESHYAPRATLRLDAHDVKPGEALLAFGPASQPAATAISVNLSVRGDLVEAAANLFSHLRALDAAGATGIAVMPIPAEGLGEAINDRLTRAAAPR
jgi:L-threonylcarbamoyladenylate synthase